MKLHFLLLVAILFNSCASVGGTYVAATALSIDSPVYAKGFALRKNGEAFILEYSYGFDSTKATEIPRETHGYGKRFASLDQKNLERLCQGDSFPTLFQQDLVLEKIYSPKFDAGGHISLASVGCPDSPIFKIVDSGRIKKPARIGLIALSLAVDAALFYAYPSIYAGVVLTGAAVGLVLFLLIVPSLH